MAEQQVHPPKPHLTVITLGHLDHGKTTLVAAITKIASLQNRARRVPYEEIESPPEEHAAGRQFRIARVEYETGTRHYTQLDCPGPLDYVACLDGGLFPLDGAILVISVSDGPMPQAREQLQLVRRANVPLMLVFLNKTDMMDGPEVIEQTQRQARELLAGAGLPGETVPFVSGSALKALESKSNDPGAPEYAPVLELLHGMDSNFGR